MPQKARTAVRAFWWILADAGGLQSALAAGTQRLAQVEARLRAIELHPRVCHSLIESHRDLWVPKTLQQLWHAARTTRPRRSR
jgi:hypothetical protein